MAVLAELVLEPVERVASEVALGPVLGVQELVPDASAEDAAFAAEPDAFAEDAASAVEPDASAD